MLNWNKELTRVLLVTLSFALVSCREPQFRNGNSRSSVDVEEERAFEIQRLMKEIERLQYSLQEWRGKSQATFPKEHLELVESRLGKLRGERGKERRRHQQALVEALQSYSDDLRAELKTYYDLLEVDSWREMQKR